MEEDDSYEASLRRRFRFARAFHTGELSRWVMEGRVCEELGISAKTLQRDIARFKQHPTYDTWRPQRRGPKPGEHRLTDQVFQFVEDRVYASAAKKLNRLLHPFA